ncbi:hypothetical protein J4221_06525 [Candidatus Pacearchaeota archaeon]|nr:hypothetical protein [Candidatus Pacearchaeota archaeon]
MENKKMNMKIGIMIIVLMSFNIISAQGLYYAVELYYDKGNINIKNVDIEFSNKELTNIVNERYLKTFNIAIVDNDKIINRIDFGVLNVMFYDVINESSENGEFIDGGMIEQDNASFIVYIPYNETGNNIIIYNDNQEIDRKDVSKFSKKDIVDKDEIDTETEKKEIFNYVKRNMKERSLYFMLFILAVLIIIIYLLIKPVKKRK